MTQKIEDKDIHEQACSAPGFYHVEFMPVCFFCQHCKRDGEYGALCILFNIVFGYNKQGHAAQTIKNTLHHTCARFKT